MTTATVERTFTDSLGRSACLHGHDWTSETIRKDACGIWHCRICARDYEKRREQRKRLGTAPKSRARVHAAEPTVAANPVAVRWLLWQLNKADSHLRGRPAVELAVRWFYQVRGHLPTIIIAAPENVCDMGEEITVRTRRAMEPIVGPTMVAMR